MKSIKFVPQNNRKLSYLCNKRIFVNILVFLLFCSIIIILFSFGKNGEEMYNDNYSNKALAKHITTNNNVYWILGDLCEYDELPSGYKFSGITSGSKETGEYSQFVTSFGNYGAKVYTCAENQDSIFVYNNKTKKYRIFVTQLLRNDWLMVDGNLYVNYSGIENYYNYMPFSTDDFFAVGTINSTIFHQLPSIDFQSNIQNSIGGEVFTDQNRSMVYIKTQNNYVKLVSKELVNK